MWLTLCYCSSVCASQYDQSLTARYQIFEMTLVSGRTGRLPGDPTPGLAAPPKVRLHEATPGCTVRRSIQRALAVLARLVEADAAIRAEIGLWEQMAAFEADTSRDCRAVAPCSG